MRWFCQTCGCFVASKFATCRACGAMHDRDNPASESPRKIRRPSARTIPRRRIRR